MRSIGLLIIVALIPFNCRAQNIFWDGIPYAVQIPKEQITHECGVAFVRLRKDLSYYATHHKDQKWGLKKLLTLLEKQRHRGQDGAGIAVVKFDVPAGQEYSQRLRFASKNALDNLFEQSMAESPLGEAMLGHIRYATHSGLDINFTQPFTRSHSIAARNVNFAGNFNLTNTNTLLTQLQKWGFSPTSSSDTQIVLESFAYQLDREDPKNINLLQVLRRAAASWDGGYVFCGILGNGDAFCCRDPAGIRPGFFYKNDEVFAVASERVALMDTFETTQDEVIEIKPGHAIIIKRNGSIINQEFTKILPERACTFERIYFSKANDPEIYQERKALGRNLAQRVYQEIKDDLPNTVFSHVPNSSLPAFQGLIDEIAAISGQNTHSEFLVAKNQKMRTFISSDADRIDLGHRLYEITQGVIKPQDTLVVVDDSLVRGTTFRDLLMHKLIKLNPKKIILVISAPPVMYPDCYGIDMSQLGKFVAFQAAVEIIKERKDEDLLKQVYTLALKQNNLPADKTQNVVARIYAGISQEQLNQKIAQLITPNNINWNGEFKIIYQSLDGLHDAMPKFSGDWYFTGNYPTSGGYKILNTAYLNWFDGIAGRSY